MAKAVKSFKNNILSLKTYLSFSKIILRSFLVKVQGHCACKTRSRSLHEECFVFLFRYINMLSFVSVRISTNLSVFNGYFGIKVAFLMSFQEYVASNILTLF